MDISYEWLTELADTGLAPQALAERLVGGDKRALARAITLIESRRGDHQAAARDLVQALLPDTRKAVRVGITGSPGVGKSTQPFAAHASTSPAPVNSTWSWFFSSGMRM